MIDDATRTEVKAELDQLAARGASYLRRFAFKTSLEDASRHFFAVSLVVPSIYLLATLASLFAGNNYWTYGFGWTLVACLLVPFVYLALATAARALTYRHDRRATLALFDRELGYRDRIQAADEFAGLKSPSLFQAAAVSDARSFISQAIETPLEPIQIAQPKLYLKNWHQGLVASGLLLVGALLTGVSLPQAAASAATEDTDDGLYVSAAEEIQPKETTRDDREKDSSSRRADEEMFAAYVNSDALIFVPLSERQEDRRGTSNSTPSAAGASASLAKQSQSGNANSEASGKTADEFKAQRAKKPDAQSEEKQKDPERRDQRNETSAGIPGGTGASSGSRMSASQTESPDNKASIPAMEDEMLDEAEDEEDEEQDAQAASKPLISQRKAPVDRNLSPSADSNEENEEANGRGGPGGLKKTRGVAAMLLGVPMPDQLQGQINQGRMKVQRERDEPTAKDVASVTAEFRGRIDQSLGSIPHHSMALSMQQVVKNYFLQKRGVVNFTDE